MRRAITIQKELEQVSTIEDLTSVFESIASTKIAKIKDKVLVSTQFFTALWKLYTSMRVDPGAQIAPVKDKGSRAVFVMITAEGGLSGDIDQKLINAVIKDYDPATTDLMVIGDHGAGQLTQRRMKYVRYFKVPESENYVDVSPILEATAPYGEITVYYEAYVSLGVQEIKKIDLIAAVRAMGDQIEPDEDVISNLDTVFEPSLDEIVDQMELTMVGLALSQVILESSLAQDASRFNAMVVAKKRASEMYLDFRLNFYQAKRSENDRRQREIMTSLKRKKRAA